MLQVGDKLPEFKGVNQRGESIDSKNYAGKKLVIFFYPKAMTPGCTAEACNLRDHFSELREKGYQLLGISADDEKKQMQFTEKHELPFDLLADTDRHAIDAFGVWQPKIFMGRRHMGIVRTTFVFDEEGTCVRVIDKVKTTDHAAQLLAEEA